MPPTSSSVGKASAAARTHPRRLVVRIGRIELFQTGRLDGAARNPDQRISSASAFTLSRRRVLVFAETRFQVEV